MPSKMVWYLMARILSKPLELRKALHGWLAGSRAGLSLFRRGRVGPDTAPLKNLKERKRQDDEAYNGILCL